MASARLLEHYSSFILTSVVQEKRNKIVKYGYTLIQSIKLILITIFVRV